MSAFKDQDKAEVIEKAVGLLQRRNGWITGAEGELRHSVTEVEEELGYMEGDNIDHGEHPLFYKTEVMAYCAIGAIFAAAGEDREELARDIIEELDELTRERGEDFDQVFELNDASSNKRKVLNTFRKLGQRLTRKGKEEEATPLTPPVMEMQPK